MTRKDRRGFTLLELIIALTISVFVLVGIIAVTTTMVRYQYDTSLKGSVTAGSLFSLQRMQKEIEDTTYIAIPSANGGTSDTLSGCTNWSAANSGADKRIDANAPTSLACTSGNVASYYYCVTGGVLYRHYACGTTCLDARSSPPAACGSSGSGWSIGAPVPSTGNPDGKPVVPAKPGISHMDSYAYYFKRVNDSQIEVHYIVGQGTYSATNVSPTSVKVNVTLTTNKAYGGTSD